MTMKTNGWVNKVFSSFFLILLSLLPLVGCTVAEPAPTQQTTAGTNQTAPVGTVMFRLTNRDNQPLGGVEVFGCPLPYEPAEILGDTDENGYVEWPLITPGQRTVTALYNGQAYVFEGMLSEADFDQVITLRISKETRLENDNYRFIRE